MSNAVLFILSLCVIPIAAIVFAIIAGTKVYAALKLESAFLKFLVALRAGLSVLAVGAGLSLAGCSSMLSGL